MRLASVLAPLRVATLTRSAVRTAGRVAPLLVTVPLIAAGCAAREPAVDPSQILPMLGAVMHSETAEVRRLAARHIGLDEREPSDGSTLMIAAAQTDQWPVVEILVDHGADIWAHDRFGITAAQRTVTSRILPGSAEDRARLRVIDKLQARGYPFPPPGGAEVLALDHAGR